jgi:predicted permease
VSLKYIHRSLLAAPAFTLGSIACLSLGLALTIAAFSVVNAALFGELPGVQDRGALRNVWLGTTRQHGRMVTSVSRNDYEAFQQGLAGAADVAAHTNRTVSLRYDADPQAARAIYVSPNYFAVLGTRPQLGAVPTGPGSVAVSDRFWRTQLGGRPDAVGQIVYVDRRPFSVGAVLPAKFDGPSPGELEEDAARIKAVWLPLDALPVSPDGDPTGRWLALVARLKPGIAEAQLQERAAAVAAGLGASDPANLPGAHAVVRSIGQGPYEESSDIAAALVVIMSVPFGILAIACANVANLLLARGTTRMREIAIRLALGASRRRIVFELLAESALLATLSAVTALPLCAAALRLVMRWLPLSIAIDWRVALFAVGAGAGTAIAFGLLPALGFSRAPMNLRIQDLRPVRPRTRRLLVATQLALSTTLLVVAALLVRSVANMTAAGERADEAQVLAITVDLKLGGYDEARGEAALTAITERVRALPGVVVAGAAPDGPFKPRHSVLLWPAEQVRERRLFARGSAITDGWFEAAGVQLIAGRDFSPHERRGTPSVVLVGEATARTFWPGGQPLGQTLKLADPRVAKGPRFTVQVIGVVSDGVTRLVDRQPSPVAYLPSPITYEPVRSVWARTHGDGRALLPQIRAIASSVAADVPITDLTTVADARNRDASPYRWLSRGLAAAGALSLGLAAFGLFSLLSYLVAQRRREVGIRMALGARREDIIRLIVGEGAVVAVGGAVLGGAAALAIAQMMREILYGIGATDPLAFAAAAGVLVATALAASAHPALRASRTDPSEILRTE